MGRWRRCAARFPAAVGVAAWVAVVAASAPVRAQAPDTSALAKIRAEGLERSQVMETLSWLTDVFGGRLTNSPAQRAAADWAERRLGSWGIAKTWRENWGPFGRGWTNELASVRAVSPQPFAIIANVEAWTPGTKGVVRGPVVLAMDVDSAKDLARYHGKLRNAFVFVSPAPKIDPPAFEPLATRHSAEDLVKATWPFPQRARPDSATMARARARYEEYRAHERFLWGERLEFFAREGALAVVNVGRGTGGTVFLAPGEGSPDPRKPAPLPVLTFASEHYGRIVRIIEKGIPVTLEANVRNTFTGGMDSASNILAELPGTDLKDQVVMLGAHFDSFHFGTGATDNGVNVATMMEAMRILKATGLPLRRTVRLALWTGEEQGLYGSLSYVDRHFVDTATKAHRPDYDRLAAYYNLDNGGGAIRAAMTYQDAQPTVEVDSTFRAWSRALAPSLGLEIVSARQGGGTDHVSFFRYGLPGFQFMQDWLEYNTRTHHSNMDTYERIVPDDVKKNAVIVASFVWLTANRDSMFPRLVAEGR